MALSRHELRKMVGWGLFIGAAAVTLYGLWHASDDINDISGSKVTCSTFSRSVYCSSSIEKALTGLQQCLYKECDNGNLVKWFDGGEHAKKSMYLMFENACNELTECAKTLNISVDANEITCRDAFESIVRYSF